MSPRARRQHRGHRLTDCRRHQGAGQGHASEASAEQAGQRGGDRQRAQRSRPGQANTAGAGPSPEHHHRGSPGSTGSEGCAVAVVTTTEAPATRDRARPSEPVRFPSGAEPEPERSMLDDALGNGRSHGLVTRERNQLDDERLPVRIDHEGVDGRKDCFERLAAMHTRPVVENDTDTGVTVGTKLIDQQGTVKSFSRPGKKVEAVARNVGPQPAPLPRGIVALDLDLPGRGDPVVGDPAGCMCDAGCDADGGCTTTVARGRRRDRQTGESERVVRPQPQRPDDEDASLPRRNVANGRTALSGHPTASHRRRRVGLGARNTRGAGVECCHTAGLTGLRSGVLGRPVKVRAEAALWPRGWTAAGSVRTERPPGPTEVRP